MAGEGSVGRTEQISQTNHRLGGCPIVFPDAPLQEMIRRNSASGHNVHLPTPFSAYALAYPDLCDPVGQRWTLRPRRLPAIYTSYLPLADSLAPRARRDMLMSHTYR
jgi:hypothetical protein